MSATGMLVSAQEVYDYTKNPFGLVYREAITEKRVGEVNIHPVKYDLNGNEIAANIYTPANYDQSKEYAAIVISHPNGGVKEQTAGLYAQRLAELGYITIAAGASYQGQAAENPAISIYLRTASTMCAAWLTIFPRIPELMQTESAL